MPKEITRTEIPTAFDVCGPLTQVNTKITSDTGRVFRNTRTYELGWIDDPNYTPKKPTDPRTKRLEVGSVTSIIDNQLRNFGLESWREGWIRDGLAENDGQVITPELAGEIMSASTREADTSAALGVELHSLIEAVLSDKDAGIWSDQLDPAMQGFLQWREAHSNLRLIGTELGVWCHQDRQTQLNNYNVSYGGQVDALFEADDVLVAVDWKSSSAIYESAAMQLAAYCVALEEMLETRQSMLDSLNGHAMLPRRVLGLIVRFDNGYPDGDRSQPKVFSGKVEEATVKAADWFPAFMNCYDLKQARKKIRGTLLPVPAPKGEQL